MALTVLIVDDHAVFRASARALLEADGLVVVGEAADGPSALAVVAETQPDVVLLDVTLPGLDGLAVAERLAALGEPPAVVLVSSRDRSSYGARVASVGARGFLSKAELSGRSLVRLVG